VNVSLIPTIEGLSIHHNRLCVCVCVCVYILHIGKPLVVKNSQGAQQYRCLCCSDTHLYPSRIQPDYPEYLSSSIFYTYCHIQAYLSIHFLQNRTGFITVEEVLVPRTGSYTKTNISWPQPMDWLQLQANIMQNLFLGVRKMSHDIFNMAQSKEIICLCNHT